MKKIMIIDGGPRKNFNTASMLQKFAEGAMSVGQDLQNAFDEGKKMASL